MGREQEKRAFEEDVFRTFLKAAPDFAEQLTGDWEQPVDDPPDVRFKDRQGQIVGVELKAWINEDQITAAKQREATQKGLLAAIGPQPPNPCQHVSHAWLLALPVRPPKGPAAATFRDELLALVSEADQAWKDGTADPRQGRTLPPSEFGDRPSLKQHLAGLTLWPDACLARKPGHDWIGFPGGGGAYGEQDMLEPLEDLIVSLREKYASTKQDKGLDRLVLLIHYDERAFQHNSPIQSPDWDFGFFAEEAAFLHTAMDELGEELSPWDEIYLLDTLEGRVVRIHPFSHQTQVAPRP